MVSALAYYQNRQSFGGGFSAQTFSSQSSGGSSPGQTSSKPSSGATPSPLLALSGKIPLGMTQGRIDHMSVDLSRGLLFVAGYGNNTVGIVDLKSGHLVRSIGGLNGPQGVAYIPDAGRLFVSNAGNGTVDIFDGNSYALVGKIDLPGDADNMRYVTSTRLLYVGYGSGGIAAINTTSDSVVMTSILPSHPESFQVETNGRAIYVNVPRSNLIMAVDRTTGNPILNRSMSGSNFPMALDEADGRLFIATWSPSELRVLDTSTPSLRSVANVTIASDADDIYYDSIHGLVYVSCGEGYLEVVKQTDPNHYNLVQTIATGPGARTSLFVPELGSIYVAVPESLGQQAELLVYSTSISTDSTSSSSVSSVSSGPSSASLSLDRLSGPTGTVVALSGGGYNPGSRYQVCVGTVGKTVCGFNYVGSGYLSSIGQFAALGNFTADSGGGIPPGTYATIPDLFGGSYVIAVVIEGKSDFLVSTPFTVTPPTLSINTNRVVAGTNVTLTGGNYTAGTTYTVCLVPQGTVDCGYMGDREETPPGIWIGTFTADSSGNIPLGTKVTIPVTPPPGEYAIGIFIPSGGFILISTASFSLDSPT